MVTTKQQVLDIAMNLTRMGNWAADGFDTKRNRIDLFLRQTKKYLESLKGTQFPSRFTPTIESFTKQYEVLHKEGLNGPSNVNIWAERMMTWGNILTHRASLL